MTTTDNSTDGQTADDAKAIPAAGDPIGVRVIYMAGYALLAYFTFWAVLILSGVQLVVKLVTQETNDDLLSLTRRLRKFLSHLVGYVSQETDDKPFPFGDFPD